MKNEQKSQVSNLITGILIAYAITAVVFIGYAMLLTYTNMTENNISLIVTITSIAAAIVAGFDAAKGAKNRGWLWGMIAGVFYALILICIMIWIQRAATFDSRTLTLIVLSIASGGLGGVLGINFNNRK
ncbi:MAG: TIGR04086 family membrane protein [Defluviitaleaceae bacterium]|nr:TIGR04086 family membrane protein [Defluviitaleaceae bacterium]